jgi:hypothetical protein
MCDQDGRSNLTNQYWGNKLGISAAHFGELSSGKASAAPLASGSTTGFGPTRSSSSARMKPAAASGLLRAIPALTVGAAPTVATLQTIEDQDFFQVTLEAGKTTRSVNMRRLQARAAFR